MTPDPAGEEGTATDGGSSSTGTTTRDAAAERAPQTGRPEGVTPAEEIDWRGWILVGLVVVCFLVIPAMVLYLPQAQDLLGSLGLSLRQAYLALPMIPAIVLGVVAVWAALRTQVRE